MHALEITFQALYPIVYYGPFLDTSDTSIPPVKLFESGSSTNRIVFNTIAVKFRISTDLAMPAASTSYYVKIRIGETVNGSVGKASIPEGLIWDNLGLADGFTARAFTVTPNADIILKNVGSLSALSEYMVGFKIAFDVSDRVTFGANASHFCAIEIVTSTGTTVVTRKWPPNMQAAHHSATPEPNAMELAETSTPPTYFHSLATVSAGNLGTISATNYGLQKAKNTNFFIWGNFANSGTVSQSFIEVVTNKGITSGYTGDQATAPVATLCFAYDNTTADTTTAAVAGCRLDIINQGNVGRQYSRLRMKA
jgi:hypothetical protein